MKLPQDIIQEYTQLLIWQYRNKTNANGINGTNGTSHAMDTISASVTPLVATGEYGRSADKTKLIAQIAQWVQDVWDVNTGIGVQLDMLGRYIGLDRTVQAQQYANNNFSYMPASTPEKAFTMYSGFSRAIKDTPPVWNGHFLTAKDRFNATFIDDATYRTLLKFKIISNHSKFSVGEIDTQLYQFFGNDITITENKNMTVTYTIHPAFSYAAQVAKAKGILPTPMGVQVVIAYT